MGREVHVHILTVEDLWSDTQKMHLRLATNVLTTTVDALKLKTSNQQHRDNLEVMAHAYNTRTRFRV